MEDGVGFEPTVALRLLLISSQMPLTTQPPFQPLIQRRLTKFCHLQINILILQCDTVRMKDSIAAPKDLWLKTPFANLVRYVPSGIYFSRIRVSGKLIRRSLKTNSLTVAKLRLSFSACAGGLM